MIDTVAQRSGQLFGESGLYCAESVLLAIAESKGIQSEFIPKIATGFCGGVSRTCGTCGAVSGAIMAINLFKGRNTPDKSVMDAYIAVRKLINLFSAKFDSINCLDLIGYDLGTDEGQRHFKEHNLIERCKDYVVEATKMAMTVIDEK